MNHRIRNRSVWFQFQFLLGFWHFINDATRSQPKETSNGEAGKCHRASIAFLKTCANNALVNRIRETGASVVIRKATSVYPAYAKLIVSRRSDV